MDSNKRVKKKRESDGKIILIVHITQDFPGSPVVKILCSTARGLGPVPGQATEIRHAVGVAKTENHHNKIVHVMPLSFT